MWRLASLGWPALPCRVKIDPSAYKAFSPFVTATVYCEEVAVFRCVLFSGGAIHRIINYQVLRDTTNVFFRGALGGAVRMFTAFVYAGINSRICRYAAARKGNQTLSKRCACPCRPEGVLDAPLGSGACSQAGKGVRIVLACLVRESCTCLYQK